MAVRLQHVLARSLRAGSIASAGAEMTFPTGKEALGLGRRLTVFEPFAAYGQVLPADASLHVQIGLEAPLNIATANDEAYWRVAAGKTFVQGPRGRAWSPMVEVLAARELAPDERIEWEILPQLQVTVSRRQHVSANVGLRLRWTWRASRRPTFVAYLTWDWFDGGLVTGWR